MHFVKALNNFASCAYILFKTILNPWKRFVPAGARSLTSEVSINFKMWL